MVYRRERYRWIRARVFPLTDVVTLTLWAWQVKKRSGNPLWKFTMFSLVGSWSQWAPSVNYFQMPNFNRIYRKLSSFSLLACFDLMALMVKCFKSLAMFVALRSLVPRHSSLESASKHQTDCRYSRSVGLIFKPVFRHFGSKNSSHTRSLTSSLWREFLCVVCTSARIFKCFGLKRS